MIIQAILIIGLLLVFIWFLANPRSYQVHAWIKIFMTLFAILAILVILLPNSANDIAHMVGVGRGADLLLYLLSLAFIFVIVNQYMRNKAEHRRFVKLARELAILEANMKRKDILHKIKHGTDKTKM